eukprot:1273200-Pleurochrysis_carterae.AAC.1
MPLHWFKNAAYACSTIGPCSLVARGRVTVHNLSLLQFSLQMSCHEIPSTHGHPTFDSESGERAKGGGSHRCAE